MTGQAWKPRSIYDACGCIEGFDGERHDHDDIVAAFQFLIDNGVVWELQGFYGRSASALLASGECHLDTDKAADAAHRKEGN